MNKQPPREFWIDDGFAVKPVYQEHKPTHAIHVIEFAAFAELQDENKSLKQLLTVIHTRESTNAFPDSGIKIHMQNYKIDELQSKCAELEAENERLRERIKIVVGTAKISITDFKQEIDSLKSEVDRLQAQNEVAKSNLAVAEAVGLKFSREASKYRDEYENLCKFTNDLEAEVDRLRGDMKAIKEIALPYKDKYPCADVWETANEALNSNQPVTLELKGGGG
jgi:chromosome segregation ATPase